MGGSHLTRTITKGTPQRSAIPSLLSLTVLDEILSILGSKVKVVAYPDKLVTLGSKIFPWATIDIMEVALRKLCSWAATCGLVINPTKLKIELRVKKSCIAFYTCKPSMIHWFVPYNIGFYRVVTDSEQNVQWNQADATGAPQFFPGNALNVILYLLPLFLRLGDSECWTAKPYAHNNILH